MLQALFFKWMVVFMSFLECSSIGGFAFMQNISSSSVDVVCWCPFLTIFVFSSSKCLQMLQLTLCQVFQIWIISLKDNNLQGLLLTLGTTSDATRKNTSGTTLAWQIIVIKTRVWLCFRYFIIYFTYFINLTS